MMIRQLKTVAGLCLMTTMSLIACEKTDTIQNGVQMKDPHSYSNPDEVQITHLHWNATVDFENRKLIATATLDLDYKNDKVTQLVLDTRNLTILSVTAGMQLNPLEWEMGDTHPVFGEPLTIQLMGQPLKVSISYETSPEAVALQWLNPEQTQSGKNPFLFTQSQAILARSWIPLQDGPQVRFTYDATVKVPSHLLALMSADNPTKKSETGVYHFKMEQPIPSYLMALAVGDLEFRPLGERSGVYAEAQLVEKAAYEFGDTESMIEKAEALYGPYLWDRYDILVLPPSFPFGGMENPRLTFATPTIIAGDRSLVALIAHELAHSWSGNLVTNATWDDFWLNEGFTVYFEGRIMEAVYGEETAEMLNTLSFQDLTETITEMGEMNADTHLKLNLAGRDPDEGMSDIAYEKGANFLRVCEEIFGREQWDAFLKSYFETHKFKSLNTEQFIEILTSHFQNADPEGLEQIRMNDWIYGPGLPDNHPVYQSVRLEAVDQMIRDYHTGKIPPMEITDKWVFQEWLYFIRGIRKDLDHQKMAELDKRYQLTQATNSEILAEWLDIAIQYQYLPAYSRLEDFLVSVGRRKFLKPLYARLAETKEGFELAREIYKRARPGYHAVSTHTIDEILKWEL